MSARIDCDEIDQLLVG